MHLYSDHILHRNRMSVVYLCVVFAAVTVHGLISKEMPTPLLILNPTSNSTNVISIVDPRFLSFAIDSHNLVKRWRSVDVTDKRLIFLTKNLYPAYLRVGGTDADIIQFVPQLLAEVEAQIKQTDEILHDVDDKTPSKDIALIPGKDFLALGKFVEATEVDFIFDLNVLLRSHNGSHWNSTNARDLMAFMSKSNIKVVGWELGNEPDRFRHVFNVTVKSPRLAEHFAMLKELTSRFPKYRKSSIIGPDVTRPTRKRSRPLKYLRGFLRHGGGQHVDKVTFHQYYFDGKTATVNDFINVTNMNALQQEIIRTKNVVKRFSAGKGIWLGETGSGWGGGCQNISDRYASSFLWLDKLGLAARYGIEVVIRQTLMGGMYGLVRLDGTPTPDYFVSVLHKRLVGRKVLDIKLHLLISNEIIPPGVRLYFHCTRFMPGALTIFGINVHESDVEITVAGDGGRIIHEYLLQAPNLTSRFSFLNGFQLKMQSDGSLPPMIPVKRTSSITFPRLTMGFWVLPRVNLSACLD